MVFILSLERITSHRWIEIINELDQFSQMISLIDFSAGRPVSLSFSGHDTRLAKMINQLVKLNGLGNSQHWDQMDQTKLCQEMWNSPPRWIRYFPEMLGRVHTGRTLSPSQLQSDRLGWSSNINKLLKLNHYELQWALFIWNICCVCVYWGYFRLKS